MARYENLKDYLQGEHIGLIEKRISEYIAANESAFGGVENTQICSLRITDDSDSYLQIDVGISADIINKTKDAKDDTRFFMITLSGSLDDRLNDLKVHRIMSADPKSFPEDDILNHFILPDVRTGDLERIGNQLASYYNRYGCFEGPALSLGRIINNMGAPLFFAELQENCLGRINFLESDSEVFRLEGSLLSAISHKAVPGTILINKKVYVDDLDGGLLVTVAHELVHWQLHQRFFKLLVLLGTDSDTMNCKTEPVPYREDMSDIEKAVCIAEWQANSLAMRLAIPSGTVDDVIKNIAADPSTHYENYGDRMQACVIKFAKIYGVSCYVAKDRLRQLGYDFVDGTILEFEGDQKKPFYFPPDTLKDNETFVIDRENYDRLMRDNKDFYDLINSGMYVYLGYVVCLLDAKFIDVESDGDGIKLVISDLARNNVSRCCLKFSIQNNESEGEYLYHKHGYLAQTKKKTETELTPSIPADVKEICDAFIEKDKEIADLHRFSETLEYHLFKSVERIRDDNGNFTHEAMRKIGELEERSSISSTMIRKYLNGEGDPGPQKLMFLCVGLELDNEESRDLISKAGFNIDSSSSKSKAFRLILGNSREEALSIANNWTNVVKYFDSQYKQKS